MKIILWGGVLTTVLVGALASGSMGENSKSVVPEASVASPPANSVEGSEGEKQQKQLFGLDLALNLNKTEELIPTPSFVNADANFDESIGAGASLIVPLKFPLNWIFPNYPPFNFTIGFNANKNASLALNATAGNVTTTTTPGWGWKPPAETTTTPGWGWVPPPETTTTPGWGWYPPQPQPTAAPSSGWTPSTTTTPGWGWQAPAETPSTPGWSSYESPPSGWSRPGSDPQSPDGRLPTLGHRPEHMSNPGKSPTASFSGLNHISGAPFNHFEGRN